MFLKKIISILFPINEIKKDLNFQYKIVDQIRNKYVLQMKNSRVTFKMNIYEIVDDKEILFNLEPVQASYIGREYFNYFKYLKSKQKVNSTLIIHDSSYLESTFGDYKIIDVNNRTLNMLLEEKSTGKRTIMDPRDLCLNMNIINKFDPSQAFYIGFHAALKMRKFPAVEKNNLIDINSKKSKLINKENHLDLN